MMNNKQKLYLSKVAADPDAAFQAFGKNYYMPWQDKASFNPAKSFMASAPVDAGKAVGKAAIGAGRSLGKKALGKGAFGGVLGSGVAKSIGTGGYKPFSRGGPEQQEQFAKNKAFFGPGFSRGMAMGDGLAGRQAANDVASVAGGATAVGIAHHGLAGRQGAKGVKAPGPAPDGTPMMPQLGQSTGDAPMK